MLSWMGSLQLGYVQYDTQGASVDAMSYFFLSHPKQVSTLEFDMVHFCLARRSISNNV